MKRVAMLCVVRGKEWAINNLVVTKKWVDRDDATRVLRVSAAGRRSVPEQLCAKVGIAVP